MLTPCHEPKPRVRQAAATAEANERKAICQSRPSSPVRQNDPCYCCREPGHVARNCPVPTPKHSLQETRPGQPSEEATAPRLPLLDHKEFRVGWANQTDFISIANSLDTPAGPWWTWGSQSPLSGTACFPTPQAHFHLAGPPQQRLYERWLVSEQRREGKLLCISVESMQTHHDFWLTNIANITNRAFA